jgi:nucleoprotein TPR
VKRRRRPSVWSVLFWAACSSYSRQTSELASTKEALSVARTAQQHLEQRVADLTASVASKEDKLAVYEGRSTSGSAADANLTREQQLEIELAELRGSLRTAQLEATQAKAHVEQYRAISQSNEDALASLTATSDEYKAQTDAALASKEVRSH